MSSDKGEGEAEGSDEEGEEELDLSSASFDPLKALYSSKAKLPCREAPVFDNITKFQLGPSGLMIKAPAKKKIKDVPEQPSTSKKPEVEEPSPITGRKAMKNILTRMEDIQGPLALLKDCMERRLRIKVFTRGPTGIRGHCVGYVAAFDKMWNLALEDVREEWTRKVKRKTLWMGPPMRRPDDSERRLRPPKILVTRLDKKTEKCERHVSQLLMRGEHVALISVVD